MPGRPIRLPKKKNKIQPISEPEIYPISQHHQNANHSQGSSFQDHLLVQKTSLGMRLNCSVMCGEYCCMLILPNIPFHRHTQYTHKPRYAHWLKILFQFTLFVNRVSGPSSFFVRFPLILFHISSLGSLASLILVPEAQKVKLTWQEASQEEFISNFLGKRVWAGTIWGKYQVIVLSIKITTLTQLKIRSCYAISWWNVNYICPPPSTHATEHWLETESSLQYFITVCKIKKINSNTNCTFKIIWSRSQAFPLCPGFELAVCKTGQWEGLGTRWGVGALITFRGMCVSAHWYLHSLSFG